MAFFKCTRQKPAIIDGNEYYDNWSYHAITYDNAKEVFLPYDFHTSSAVSLNNKIHLFGSGNTQYARKHFVWNGDTWEELLPIPFDFYNGCALTVGNTVHLLGGEASPRDYYTYTDTDNWLQQNPLPYDFYGGTATMYNNELHLMCSQSENDSHAHYVYRNNTWIKLDDLNAESTFNNSFVYEDALCVSGDTFVFKYDPVQDTWSCRLSLIATGVVIPYNETLALIGSEYVYALSGTALWDKHAATPYENTNGSVIIHKDEIHLIGGSSSESSYKHYILSVPLYSASPNWSV